MGLASGDRGAATGPALVPRNLELALANPGGDRWVEVDVVTPSISAEEQGVGRLIATYGPIPHGRRAWLLRAYIETTSTNPTSMTGYIDDEQNTQKRTYTDEGDLNELVEEGAGILIPADSSLLLVWEGSSAAANAFANLQLRIEQDLFA